MFNLTLEEEKMSGELTKYHMRGFPFYGVFHRFTGKDMGLPHDHPFPFTSLILSGGYTERIWFLDGTYTDMPRRVGDFIKFEADHIHQIIELPEGECWTFIVPGKHVDREWGFYFFGVEILHRFHNEAEFKSLKGK